MFSSATGLSFVGTGVLFFSTACPPYCSSPSLSDYTNNPELVLLYGLFIFFFFLAVVTKAIHVSGICFVSPKVLNMYVPN